MYQHIDPDQPRRRHAELLRSREQQRAARRAARANRTSTRPTRRRFSWRAVVQFAQVEPAQDQLR